MDIEILLKQKIDQSLNKIGLQHKDTDIIISTCKDKAHGDYSSNVAMRFASQLKKNPREIANLIIENIDREGLDNIEVAGPGFINFFVSNNSLTEVVSKILNEGAAYGQGKDKNCKVNIEFVSANPTGYLHLGHARIASIGDCIARILAKDGYTVTREYYINDAGNQINNLGRSVYGRYKELYGTPIVFDDDMYRGHEIIEIAELIKKEKGDSLLADEIAGLAYCKAEGMKLLLAQINEDLEFFRVKFDIYTHELDVRANGAVEKEIENMSKYIYKDGDALVLKTTDFLDDKDRVIVKSNGDFTYFLPDIVYHLNKLSRGYDKLIDLFGADHHGYINRMKSALMMYGYDKDILDIELVQMVRIFKDGQEVKLSKRTGQTITLRELCEEAGIDGLRYFMAARSADAHLDFDINLAREQSSSNPVYYAQYAHARLASVMKNEKEYGINTSASLLKEEKEMSLLKILIEYPTAIHSAAEAKQPYLVTNFVNKLATAIHSFYTQCRIIDPENKEMTQCRLALAKAAMVVMKDALGLIGVSAPEKM